MSPTHCDITIGVYWDIIAPLLCTTFYEFTSALGKEHFTHCKCEQNYRILIFDSNIIYFLKAFYIKQTFSFLQNSALNIRFETRIHQRNENVHSTSCFKIISNLCSDFEVTFLIYLGWIVKSAMLLYVIFNILQKWYHK